MVALASRAPVAPLKVDWDVRTNGSVTSVHSSRRRNDRSYGNAEDARTLFVMNAPRSMQMTRRTRINASTAARETSFARIAGIRYSTARHVLSISSLNKVLLPFHGAAAYVPHPSARRASPVRIQPSTIAPTAYPHCVEAVEVF